MNPSGRTISCKTEVHWINGRAIVLCEIQYFIPSGLTVDALFGILRPKLEASMRTAAMSDLNPGAMPRPTSVQMDEGVVDPEISIFIHSPAAVLEKLDEHLAWVQSTVERFVTGHNLHRSKVEMGSDPLAAGDAPQ